MLVDASGGAACRWGILGGAWRLVVGFFVFVHGDRTSFCTRRYIYVYNAFDGETMAWFWSRARSSACWKIRWCADNVTRLAAADRGRCCCGAHGAGELLPVASGSRINRSTWPDKRASACVIPGNARSLVYRTSRELSRADWWAHFHRTP